MLLESTDHYLREPSAVSPILLNYLRNKAAVGGPLAFTDYAMINHIWGSIRNQQYSMIGNYLELTMAVETMRGIVYRLHA